MTAASRTTLEPFQPTFNPIPLDRNNYSSCIYPGDSEALRLFADRYGPQLQGLTVKSKGHLLGILRRWKGAKPRHSIYEAIVEYLHIFFSDDQLNCLSKVIDVFALERLENLSDSEALHLLSHLEIWKRESKD
ncbi:hypothetical protein [Phormidesmis sp. 146-33]